MVVFTGESCKSVIFNSLMQTTNAIGIIIDGTTFNCHEPCYVFDFRMYKEELIKKTLATIDDEADKSSKHLIVYTNTKLPQWLLDELDSLLSFVYLITCP